MIVDLRRKIMEMNKHACSHVGASDLTLCVPTIHIPFANKDHFKTQFSQLQGGKAFVEVLNPASTVAESGLSRPVEGQLHLLVVIPSKKTEEPAVRLTCLVYDGNPAIKPLITVKSTAMDATIQELQKKVWEEMKYRYAYLSANDLTLYTPKTPLSLADKDLFVLGLYLDVALSMTVEELSTALTVENSGLFQLTEGQVNLIVVIPPEPDFEVADLRLAHIRRRLRDIILSVPESERSRSTDQTDDNPFKLALYKSCHEPLANWLPETLTCSLTGVTLSSRAIGAAHLWPYSSGIWWGLFGFDNIDDTRNGLLLYRPIAEEFGRSNICIYQDNEGMFRCRVLLESLRCQRLKDSFRRSKASDIEEQQVQTAIETMEDAGYLTFADLERPEVYLRFPSTMCEHTKLVLNFLAIRAYLLARERGDVTLQNFGIENLYFDSAYFSART